jgi:hypothetical protein
MHGQLGNVELFSIRILSSMYAAQKFVRTVDEIFHRLKRKRSNELCTMITDLFALQETKFISILRDQESEGSEKPKT